ncbi:MAG: hypothetical protein IKZ89_01860 [Bacteroidaceae bacterium]|nr:hypothetical protein [Bacteroidaceae bacterium]
MKTNRLIFSGAFLTLCLAVNAQTSFDAAKLYDEELNGTARYVGMGGAMSALGSDPSVMSRNPAGIGTYRQSDINMSLSFWGSSVETDPLANSFSPITVNGTTYYSSNLKSNLDFRFDNVSVVFCGNTGGDVYTNIGFSYRRSLDMDRGLDYIDKFFDVDETDPSKKYVVYREYKDQQRNRINNYDFNVSCNLSDIVYLGWTLELITTEMRSEGYFYDYFPSYNDAVGDDKKYVADDFYDYGFCYTGVDKMNSSKGNGWNMSLGMILRPLPGLRLGVSFKTPTIFKQRMDYVEYCYAYQNKQFTDDNGNVEKYSNSVDYKFSSPWKINLSTGLTLGKTAIGLEYEKNYTQRSSLKIGETNINNQGAVHFNDYSSFRAGIEQNIDKLSLRAGYNSSESIFKDGAKVFLDDTFFNTNRLDFQVDRLSKSRNYTLGLGYCSEPDREGSQFYFDVAYVHGIRKSVVNMNEPIKEGEINHDIDVNYKYSTDKVMFTFGWNF